MTTSTARRRTSLIAAILIGVCASASAAGEDPPPNIVLLFADDLGYGELGCQGNAQIPTPHIDSIAAGGVRFTSGYVTAPYCSASRAGLLTGRYQTRFGYEFNPVGHHNSDPRVGLPRFETTLAELLSGAGYATGLVGKWHLGGTDAAGPLRHGFHHFFGFLHEGHYFVPPPYDGVTTMLRRRVLPNGRRHGRWQSSMGDLVLSAHMKHDEPAYDAGNPIMRDGQPVAEQEYLTDAFTREAVSFIRRHRERPFFLYVAYNAVHSPLQAREEDMQRFSHIPDVHRRIFAGMLSRLDQSVGAILTALKESGTDRRTLVFFISDNGGPTRELTSSNAPLRGGKGTVYEGGIRVPFLMQWPGVIPAGTEFRQPVISLDVWATAAAVCGAGSAEKSDGVNLLPHVTGQATKPPHETLFWRLGGRTALRHGRWKLLRQRQAWELYDLEEDLEEANNLAQANTEELTRLREVWEKLNAEMSEPLWKPTR